MQIKTISAQETLDIRHRVLWPDKSIQHCIVESDDTAVHYGIFINEVLVGVASTYDDAGSVRLRKFAVEEHHQGKGYGSTLLKHIISETKKMGANTFWCDARASATEFYKHFGLITEGDEFYKSGIAYYRMSKQF